MDTSINPLKDTKSRVDHERPCLTLNYDTIQKLIYKGLNKALNQLGAH